MITKRLRPRSFPLRLQAPFSLNTGGIIRTQSGWHRGAAALACIAVITRLTLASGASAQTQPASPAGGTTAAAPVVSDESDRLLKEVGAYIGSAQQFTFHADITFDHVLPSGQKLQFSA